MATSIALKCSLSKELLHDLEKGVKKLDLEADASLSKMKEKSDEVSPVSTDCATDSLKGKISFKIPQVVKGAKKKRTTNILEKNTGKKKKQQQYNPVTLGCPMCHVHAWYELTYDLMSGQRGRPQT